ncbi:MAG: SURF1 family protein [Pseudomonadota bacterium]
MSSTPPSRPVRSRLWAPLILGVLGTGILIALCVWQIQRLAWKEGVLAELEERLRTTAVELPDSFDPARDEFRRVAMFGAFVQTPGAHGFVDAPLLDSLGKRPGYRIIQPFRTNDGRTIMVSRGWVPLEAKNIEGRAARPIPAPVGETLVVGSLRWPEDPQEPAFGPNDNVWIARNLDAYARVFGAERVLVVAETPSPGPRTPSPSIRPLTTAIVPNNHRGYAITWGLLAATWAAMTAYWGWTRRAAA